MTSRRIKCTECGWVGSSDNVVIGNNKSEKNIIVCPKCNAIHSMYILCDKYGCDKIGTYSYVENGEEHITCGEHYRWPNTQRT